MSEPQVTRNDDGSRYELHLDGQEVGHIEYRREDDVVDLVHTIVDPDHEGKGYAGKLAGFALEDIREAGLQVRPTCPYIARYIEKNPEFGSLVTTD